MKKLTILVVAVVAAGAFAQSHRAMAKGPGKKISCAVMKGNKVDITTATRKKMFADYKGNRYFFCCADCPKAFRANPAKFAKSPHTKTPKKR